MKESSSVTEDIARQACAGFIRASFSGGSEADAKTLFYPGSVYGYPFIRCGREGLGPSARDEAPQSAEVLCKR